VKKTLLLIERLERGAFVDDVLYDHDVDDNSDQIFTKIYLVDLCAYKINCHYLNF